MLTQQQIEKYLERIGFTGKVETTFACLQKIAEKHARTFPYENLNLHDSRFDSKPRSARSNIDEDALFEKMVLNGRGGRCVELNFFLQAVLKTIGFDVTPIAPDVLFFGSGTGLRHSAAIVTLNSDEFLVDAAFGELGIFSPVPLKVGEYQLNSEKFNLVQGSNEDYRFELQVCTKSGHWKSLYAVPKKSARLEDYIQIDTSFRDFFDYDSPFKNLFMCTVPFDMEDGRNGRYFIENNVFKVLERGKVQKELVISDQAQLREVLAKHFKIHLSPEDHIRFTEQEMQAYMVTHQPEHASVVRSYDPAYVGAEVSSVTSVPEQSQAKVATFNSDKKNPRA